MHLSSLSVSKSDQHGGRRASPDGRICRGWTFTEPATNGWEGDGLLPDIAPPHLALWLLHDHWTAGPDLMKYIDYKKLNLKEPFSFATKFNLILCRNVLIYQSVEGKKEILKKITEALEPGGFLILGCGESLLGLSDCYEQSTVEGAVIYKRKETIIKAA